MTQRCHDVAETAAAADTETSEAEEHAGSRIRLGCTSGAEEDGSHRAAAAAIEACAVDLLPSWASYAVYADRPCEAIEADLGPRLEDRMAVRLALAYPEVSAAAGSVEPANDQAQTELLLRAVGWTKALTAASMQLNWHSWA